MSKKRETKFGLKVPESFRVVLLGSESSGKTSLLLQFLNKSFTGDDDPTIEDTHAVELLLDEKPCSLEILDTGGNLAYESLRDKWLHWGQAFVVVYAITNEYSIGVLPELTAHIERIKGTPYFPMVIAGTQCDRENLREVPREKALEVAYNYGASVYEVSAKTGENVDRLFKDLIKMLRAKKKEDELLDSYEASLIPKGKKKNALKSSVKPPRSTDIIDGALSIVKDPERRISLCGVVPKVRVAPLRMKSEIVLVRGPPDDESPQQYGDYVYARSVSTYPHNIDTGKREGDPICDQYNLIHFENRTIVALADGCSWGPEPRDAAFKSVKVFVDYMRKYQKELSSAEVAPSLMLRAFLAAHNSIIEGRNEETLFQAGSTTMLAGMVVELADQPHKWAFVCASLGDCKAYHWSSATKEVNEITKNNRQNINDPKDPGGRLGPYREGGAPDLRNLSIFWYPCNEDDIIIMVSDGVYDNLDPQQLGKTPKELSLAVNEWKDLDRNQNEKAYEEAEKIKGVFVLKFLSLLIGSDDNPTPASISQKLIDHCIKVTKNSRDFMENKDNSNKKLPPDYTKYPGKMDHTTCVSFKVGQKGFLSTSNNNTSKQGMVSFIKNAPRSQHIGTTGTGKPHVINSLRKSRMSALAAFTPIDDKEFTGSPPSSSNSDNSPAPSPEPQSGSQQRSSPVSIPSNASISNAWVPRKTSPTHGLGSSSNLRTTRSSMLVPSPDIFASSPSPAGQASSVIASSAQASSSKSASLPVDSVHSSGVPRSSPITESNGKIDRPASTQPMTSAPNSSGLEKRKSFNVSTDTQKTPASNSKTDWKECTSKTGEKFFYNLKTGESRWEDPWKTQGEWRAYYDDKGELYYYNTQTRQTVWELPGN